MRILKSCLPCLLPISILTLAGCGGGRHETTEVYYLVAANTKIAYWQEAKEGLYAAAKQLGVRSEMVGPEGYDPEGEKREFDRIVASQPAPAGILVSPTAPELMRGSIDAAIAKGIPVVTMDSDDPKSKRLLFIGTDNYQAGQLGGEVVASELNGKGSVVVYTIEGQLNLVERLEGYTRVFVQHPGIQIVHTIDIKGDPIVAFERTKELVEKGEIKPDAFVCLEALACQEVADVLDRHKVTGKLVMAMDTNRSTLEWIRKGLIHATIAQKPYTMAFYGLKVLDDLHHHRPPELDANWGQNTQAPIPVLIDTGVTLVDKGNVDAFMHPLRVPAQ